MFHTLSRAYGYGRYHGLHNHYLGKREAEAGPEAEATPEADGYYGHYYTLESGINIRVRLLIFEVCSRGYVLIKGGYVY